MKIGIIGAGHIGSALGRHWTAAGHAVMFASRNPGDLSSLAARTGAGTGTPEQAAAFGAVVAVATPYGAWPELGRALASALEGKVVIDAANPYPGRDGTMAEAALARGSGLATAAFVPGARVVKAFNTLPSPDLAAKGGEGFAMAIAGDDAEAVELVAGLVRDAGFDPVVAGGLAEARRFDAGQPAYARLADARRLADLLALAEAA